MLYIQMNDRENTYDINIERKCTHTKEAPWIIFTATMVNIIKSNCYYK